MKAGSILNKHFQAKVNIPIERYHSRKMKQDENKSAEQVITRLIHQGVSCSFDNTEEQICDRVIEKCRSHTIRTNAVRKGTGSNT